MVLMNGIEYSAFKMQEIIDEEAPGIHGYMPNPGYPAVREAIAAQMSSEQ